MEGMAAISNGISVTEEGPEWDFKFGLILDSEYTEKLARLCAFGEIDPHDLIRQAIDTMITAMENADG